MMERLKILNEMSPSVGKPTLSSLAPAILEGAYKYVRDPKAVSLSKMPLEYRAEFTDLVLFFKKVSFRMPMQDAQAEAEKVVSNADLRARVKAIIGEIYAKSFAKIKLLEPKKVVEKEQAMFYVGNVKEMVPVTDLLSDLRTLKTLRWKVKVIISNNTLSRVLPKSIIQ